nr:transposon ty3-g gag-pol polyprotein [Quercus suber]
MVEEEPGKPTKDLEDVKLIEGDPSKVTKVKGGLNPQLKDKIVEFMKKNLDILAWGHEDMSGIDNKVIEHQLNVNPTKKPVQQKRRVFALEMNRSVMEEVEKLLTTSFIREVFYPKWLTSVVMVKKSNEKWRMCIDFTDLNHTCLKDSFPLPKIDQLMDSIAGHELLTFMDAFSGYNQIHMNEEDREKIAFVTSQRLYYYKITLFGLKNAGATYQRLVNHLFNK